MIGPLLANLFLHYVFDEWMKRKHSSVPFERYADDTICHCSTKSEAEQMKEFIKLRLNECGLELNESKTKIVYCKDANRKESSEKPTFDFLGYTFRPRRAKNRKGEYFLSFLPAISAKATKYIGATMREWWKTSRTDKTVSELASMINPQLQGWINYYGRFYKTGLYMLFNRLNVRLTIWVTKKYRRFKQRITGARKWLIALCNTQPQLFAHWKFVKPRGAVKMSG